MGFEYEILLNLNTDGTVEGSGYNILSMDTSTYTENSGFYDDWIGGSWEEGEDEEGQECIVLETVFRKGCRQHHARRRSLDGNGAFLQPLPPIRTGPSPSRLIGLSSRKDGRSDRSSTITYHDKDSFIKGVAYQFDEPENSLAMFADETAHFHLYCLDDNTTVLASERKIREAKTTSTPRSRTAPGPTRAKNSPSSSTATRTPTRRRSKGRRRPWNTVTSSTAITASISSSPWMT